MPAPRGDLSRRNLPPKLLGMIQRKRNFAVCCVAGHSRTRPSTQCHYHERQVVKAGTWLLGGSHDLLMGIWCAATSGVRLVSRKASSCHRAIHMTSVLRVSSPASCVRTVGRGQKSPMTISSTLVKGRKCSLSLDSKFAAADVLCSQAGADCSHRYADARRIPMSGRGAN